MPAITKHSYHSYHSYQLAFLALFLLVPAKLAAATLSCVCSVPELGDLVGVVGGDRVTVVTLARPQENPHFITARPSFIHALSQADVWVTVGLDLEVGWAPALLRNARNARIEPGALGAIDCSHAIAPMLVPQGVIDRSLGDVHPHGNPHYLLSPISGLQVVYYLGERFAALDPSSADAYRQRAETYRRSLAIELYGEAVVQQYGIAQLIEWHVAGTLFDHVDEHALGGWLADVAPMRGMAVIDDHQQWPYFSHCYGITVVAHLEPKAGIPPSSAYIHQLIQQIGPKSIGGIMTSPWFDPQYARLIAESSHIPIIELAHQAGSLPNTKDYLSLCAHNVQALRLGLDPQPNRTP